MKEGNTSVTYHVQVYRKTIECCGEVQVFSTNVVLVNIDCNGVKRPLVK
jgi:acyl-CoA hydrolase